MRLKELEKNQKSANYDFNKRKKSAALALEDYKDKKKQQEDFNITHKKSDGASEKFTFHEQGEILDEQVKLALIKKEFAELKIKEAEARLALVDSQLMITKGQIGALKDDYIRIKRSLNVDARFVKKSKMH